ncbi:type II secretion system minor pseudopilin GspH [Thiofilum flexile]|uniref:type II secretion system minor pseudopilin GspH n=1 Tax=Thiofilum flexile TaxID=125627 RepID=UPI000373D6F2|nr:type II secretion system minor pseudopilin GspH [Thiofilum flexile]
MPARYTGFSLLEMLLVLIILGVLYGIASVSLSSVKTNPIDQASNEFSAVLRLAQNEAVVSSRVLGLLIDQKGYQFFEQTAPKQWQLVTLAKQQRYEFDPSLKEQLYLEQVPVILPDYVEPTELEKLFNNTDESPRQPQIVFLPTGEMTPFGFAWLNAKDELKQEWDSLGRVRHE